MAEIPILFRGPLVRAILDGRKTVTRRLCPAQPRLPGVTFESDPAYPGAWLWGTPAETLGTVRCPYGVPGDTLWVRETWRTAAALDALSPTKIAAACLRAGYETPWAPLHYEANDGSLPRLDPVQWQGWSARARPAIHMPRWASRLTLDVVSVRAERLQDIDDADARREGVEALDDYHDAIEYAGNVVRCGTAGIARGVFASLWDSINGKRPGASWDANPWVWRVEFKRAANVAAPHD